MSKHTYTAIWNCTLFHINLNHCLTKRKTQCGHGIIIIYRFSSLNKSQLKEALNTYNFFIFIFYLCISLSAKHPKSPPSVPPAHPPLPLTSPILPPDFNVLSILRSFPKASAAGPTGLRIQHLLDVAEVPVPTSICSLLRGVINLLTSGQAPAAISQYMAGGSLVALRKGTQDIRPIAVGESLRRLTSKCLCSLIKEDASAFFQPFQFGVALPQGCEKVIHGLRRCLDNHWHDSEFVCLKVDMKNAFNLVSRQSLLDQCTLHFPLLLPWTTWCYGQHPFLWHFYGNFDI